MFLQSKIKYRLTKDRNTIGNMGFAAMLTEDYILNFYITPRFVSPRTDLKNITTLRSSFSSLFSITTFGKLPDLDGLP